MMATMRPTPPTTDIVVSNDPYFESNLLNTNNPFRNSLSPHLSPTEPVRRSPPASASMARPLSTNPFIDPPAAGNARVNHDTATARLADDIFKEQPQRRLAPIQPGRGAPRAPGSPLHRPSRSGEAPPDGQRAPMRPPGPPPGRSSPTKSTRPRRNSESSVMDKDKAEEERRRRERRREREANGDKSGKSKDAKPRSSRRAYGLDVIDKLDVTGIYGQGLFHHDGPFDACNPHRNRKNNQRAPMHAFPANSANNALGGGAPKRFDYDNFHGRGVEGFNDYAYVGGDNVSQHSRPKREQDRVATVIDTTARVEQIHGEQSTGLGTSTFLEGAPAPRSAVQRAEAENSEAAMAAMAGPGLGRKKSLAMRIRGMSQSRPNIYNGRVVSPDGYPPTPNSPPLATQSAGGPNRAWPIASERNPFFAQDHEDGYDKKGARAETAELRNRRRAPSSPESPQLTRAITSDGQPSKERGREGSGSGAGGGGGFLGRMKSLRGKSRPRPEIRT